MSGLPASAHPAWRAYAAMLNSKREHFGFLEELDKKYQAGGVRTLAEKAHLATLLDAHDRCVREFAAAIKALAQIDIPARDRLLRLIEETGEVLSGPPH